MYSWGLGAVPAACANVINNLGYKDALVDTTAMNTTKTGAGTRGKISGKLLDCVFGLRFEYICCEKLQLRALCRR